MNGILSQQHSCAARGKEQPCLLQFRHRQGTSPLVSVLLFGSCHLILFVSSTDNFQIVMRQCSFEGSDTMTVTKYCLFSSLGR